MKHVRILIIAIWCLAIAAAAQEQPSPTPSPGAPPSPPPPLEEEPRLVQLNPLRVQYVSGVVFLGFVTDPGRAELVLEYSQNLRWWQSDVAGLAFPAPPPPPPIALIDRLERLPGQNLRLIPLEIRNSSEGFFRTTIRPVTGTAPTSPDAGGNPPRSNLTR